MSFHFNQLFNKQGSPGLVASMSNNSLTTVTSSPNISNSPISSTNSNALNPITSPFELHDIPNESDFVILTTKNFTISLKLLDKIIYLRSDESGSKFTPLRGYICITIRKPVRISNIKLQFKGVLNMKLFPKTSPPDPNSYLVKNHEISIFTQSRSWQYKQNDKVLDPDYFAKGSFTYPFQFLIPNDIPESMFNVFGSTSYSLNVKVNQISKSLTSSLLSQNNFSESLQLQIVQCETEDVDSSTASDALSLGNWRNLLYYKIVVTNRQIAIGHNLKIYIKILPIDAEAYKIKNIKIFLDQITEYNGTDHIPENIKNLYHLNLCYTESILLEEINSECLENEIETWELDTKVNKVHMKYNNLNSKLKKEVIVVPSTNNIENKICHFKVNHKVKVIITVEEISKTNFEDFVDNSDLESSLTTFSRNRSYSQTADKTLLNTRAEKADNEMIKKMAKLVPENSKRKSKVELILESDIEILKDESIDGNMPPPTYSDAQLERKFVNKVEDTKKQPQITIFDKKNKPQLNFIVPPAYEEIEELFQPPPYIKKL